jgi:hypothetical protein
MVWDWEWWAALLIIRSNSQEGAYREDYFTLGLGLQNQKYFDVLLRSTLMGPWPDITYSASFSRSKRRFLDEIKTTSE